MGPCTSQLISLFHSCTFLLSRSGTVLTRIPYSTCADGWHPRVPLSTPRPVSSCAPSLEPGSQHHGVL